MSIVICYLSLQGKGEMNEKKNNEFAYKFVKWTLDTRAHFNSLFLTLLMETTWNTVFAEDFKPFFSGQKLIESMKN